DGKSRVTLDLVGDAGAHHGRHLAEIDAVVDDDVELEREAVVDLAHANAAVAPAREQPERPAPTGLVDDAEGLVHRTPRDGGDGARRHRHAAVTGHAHHDRALPHDPSLVPSVGGSPPPVASDGLYDLAGLEAAGADVVTRGLAVEHEPDALQVRVEAALRGD